MTETSVYETWYKNNHNKQNVANPIDFTLDGLTALLNDPTVDQDYKYLANEFLERTRRINHASNLLAAFCALGAAFSSMAYFLLIRDHCLELSEWEYLIAPTLAGLFVAGATWYTYRHDTAEWMLNFEWPTSKNIDSKDLCVYLLTFLVVSMEIALSGYGVTELELGEGETTMLILVCLATIIPEWAQTHKYLEKWMLTPSRDDSFKEDADEHKDAKNRWLNFYKVSSLITLAFWGMAIFPLIEDNSNTVLAIAAVIFYVFMGKPYMKEKAHDQVVQQFASQETESENAKNEPKTLFERIPFYPLSRVGNGIGDLAFSAYGFFETLKAFNLMSEDAKPIDSFKLCGSGDETLKTWVIIISAVIVVGASCVGSFLMSAGGDQESYGDKIAKVAKVPEGAKAAVADKKVPVNQNIEGRPPPSAASKALFSSMWHSNNIPPYDQVQKKTPDLQK